MSTQVSLGSPAPVPPRLGGRRSAYRDVLDEFLRSGEGSTAVLYDPDTTDARRVVAALRAVKRTEHRCVRVTQRGDSVYLTRMGGDPYE